MSNEHFWAGPAAQAAQADISRLRINRVKESNTAASRARLAGEKLWNNEDVRKEILKILDKGMWAKLATVNRTTFDDIVPLRYKHLKGAVFERIAKSIPVARWPSYFWATTSLEIQQERTFEWRRGYRSTDHGEVRARSNAKGWLPVLSHLPSLQTARFSDLSLKRVNSTNSALPTFYATRLIERPLRNALKCPLENPNIAAPGVVIILNPEVDIKLRSTFERKFDPTVLGQSGVIRPSQVNSQIMGKFIQQLSGRTNIFAHPIGRFDLAISIPLDVIQILYAEGAKSRPLPPSRLHLDCSFYTAKTLEEFCFKATPRLKALEIGPHGTTSPSMSLADLLHDFDWSSLGSISSLKVHVTPPPEADWERACRRLDWDVNREEKERPARSLQQLVIVFHGLPPDNVWPNPEMRAESANIRLAHGSRIKAILNRDHVRRRLGQFSKVNLKVHFLLWHRETIWEAGKEFLISKRVLRTA